MGKLLFIGQMAEKQEERSFLVAVSVLGFNILHQIVYVVASVNELTGDRLYFTLVEQISVNIADICYACNDTCAVTVSQTFFNVILFV